MLARLPHIFHLNQYIHPPLSTELLMHILRFLYNFLYPLQITHRNHTNKCNLSLKS